MHGSLTVGVQSCDYMPPAALLGICMMSSFSPSALMKYSTGQQSLGQRGALHVQPMISMSL